MAQSNLGKVDKPLVDKPLIISIYTDEKRFARGTRYDVGLIAQVAVEEHPDEKITILVERQTQQKKEEK